MSDLLILLLGLALATPIVLKPRYYGEPFIQQIEGVLIIYALVVIVLLAIGA